MAGYIVPRVASGDVEAVPVKTFMVIEGTLNKMHESVGRDCTTASCADRSRAGDSRPRPACMHMIARRCRDILAFADVSSVAEAPTIALEFMLVNS